MLCPVLVFMTGMLRLLVSFNVCMCINYLFYDVTLLIAVSLCLVNYVSLSLCVSLFLLFSVPDA